MIKKVILLAALFTVYLLQVRTVHASLLEDFLNKAKEILGNKSTLPQSLTIKSEISLAPNGDVNKNNQIDAGDTITFTYIINNSTDQEFSFNTLKTNIQKDKLNFIHDIKGTANLSDKNNTIEIPYLRINPHQVLTISFNARINYFTDTDESIGTEPEFLNKDKQSIFKAVRKEIKAKVLKEGKLPSMVKTKNK